MCLRKNSRNMREKWLLRHRHCKEETEQTIIKKIHVGCPDSLLCSLYSIHKINIIQYRVVCINNGCNSSWGQGLDQDGKVMYIPSWKEGGPVVYVTDRPSHHIPYRQQRTWHRYIHDIHTSMLYYVRCMYIYYVHVCNTCIYMYTYVHIHVYRLYLYLHCMC